MNPVDCRACGAETGPVIDFGPMPLAGDFRTPGERNELYPLAVDACGSCGLLQVRETVDPHVLFGPDYRYASSTVPSLVRHFQDYAAEDFGHGKGRLVLDVGCNDGILLEPLSKLGWRAAGVDASDNVAEMAREKGFDVHTGFFDSYCASLLTSEYGQFDVVTCSNVFAHNPDLRGFVDALDEVLKPGGEFWVEVQDAEAIYSNLYWDQFYHEHCFYWTPAALTRFLKSRGYGLVALKRTPMHGGAIRAMFSNDSMLLGMPRPPGFSVSRDDWLGFRGRALRSREAIIESVDVLAIGYAYGAAGRAVTLINWTGIADCLDFVVDGSPLRHGRAIPNTGIPIISEHEFFSKPRDSWCFVTAHDKIGDIRLKVETNLPGPHRFVVPLPEVRIT